jgi:hypothetical protein
VQSSRHILPIDSAAQLASLAGALADMTRVHEYCARMIERYSGGHLKKTPFDIVGFNTHFDHAEWDAYTSAACVAYARCFVEGVRLQLRPEVLPEGKGSLRELHEFVITVRHRHIAHSVNRFEENVVSVDVSDAMRASTEIATVNVSSSAILAADIALPEELRTLSSWWIEYIHRQIAEERARLLAAVHQLSLDDVRAFPVHKEKPKGRHVSDPAKPRRGRAR